MKISKLTFKEHSVIRNNNMIFFYDYLIDNIYLKDIINSLKSNNGVYIDYKNNLTPLGFYNREGNNSIIYQMLLEKESDLKPGRIPIYVCPECGDYACGVISVNIIKDNDLIIWNNFGSEVDYNDDFTLLDKRNKLCIYFSHNEYREELIKLFK